MQGFPSLRKLKENKEGIYSGNRIHSDVKVMGTFRLILKSRLILDLKNIFYVPSFSRSLISISRVYNIDYGLLFDENSFSILKNKVSIGGGILVNGLYRIDLIPSFELNYLSIHVDFGIKMIKIDEDSSMLYNRKFYHISIERIKRFMNDKVLNTLDFIDFGTYVDCIKEKQTTKTTKGSTRSL
jgi:hypothetical protein